MRAFALLARVFSLIVVDSTARGGGQEKLTQELILAASPFVKEANNGWKPSSLARQLILSSGGTTWRRGTDSEEGGRQQQARRGGRSLYSPYSPGLDALRCMQQHSHDHPRISFYSSGVKLWFVFVFAVCSVSILNNKPVRLNPDGATSHRFKVAPALRNESAKHELLGFYLRDDCAGACTNMQRLVIWLRGYKCCHNFSPEPIRRPQECPISAIIAWKN